MNDSEKYYYDLLITKLRDDITTDLLKELENKYSVEIITNEIDSYFNTTEITFENVVTSTDTKYINRDNFLHIQDRCQARVWNRGYGGQCGRTYHGGRHCLCKKHETMLTRDKELWLGYIDEKRPIDPIHPINKRVHIWKSSS